MRIKRDSLRAELYWLNGQLPAHKACYEEFETEKAEAMKCVRGYRRAARCASRAAKLRAYDEIEKHEKRNAEASTNNESSAPANATNQCDAQVASMLSDAQASNDNHAQCVLQ